MTIKACNCIKTLNDDTQSYINVRGKYHDPSQVLTYSFMEGTEPQKEHVRRGVQKILSAAPGLKIEEVDINGDVRITFNPANGAYSYVGTDIFRVPRDQETMNIGFIDRYHSVVIHEWLHTLNFSHEHLRGINWDRDKVYDFFADIGWSRADVDNNLFEFDPDEMDYSDIDVDSIMLYGLPCSLTTDGKNCGVNNIVMSQGDIDRLNELFPVKEDPVTTEPEEPASECLLVSMRKIFSRKKDLACLREANLVILAKELGLETDIRFRKSHTVDLLWNVLNQG